MKNLRDLKDLTIHEVQAISHECRQSETDNKTSVTKY